MNSIELKVGDKILIQSIFSKYIVEIERVKTVYAFTKPYNDAGAFHKFKKKFNGDPTIAPRPKWDQRTFTLLK